MARISKIDPVELKKMLGKGIPQTKIATHFGVTPQAVSIAKRTIKKALAGVSTQSAPAIHKREINALDQLQKINGDANEILDLLMKWNKGDETALRVLESQVKRVKTGNGDEIEVSEIKMKDPRELALKAMAEIRCQLKLQLEIFQALYDIKAAEEFQAEVLQTIGEVDTGVRDRIVYRLRQRRAVRAVIQPN